MNALIVVPARYASTRLPGKPLHPIAGRTLLERVVDIARRAAAITGAGYVVATDDDRIADHCRAIDAPHAMTDPKIASGSDRALAAALQAGTRPDIVANLQGDAPFTEVGHVVDILRRVDETSADVATPVIRLGWDGLDRLRERKKTTPFSGTTCVRAVDGRALWFSKTVLPVVRNDAELRRASPLSPVLRHVGLYCYRFAALQRFSTLPLGEYEKLEGLEQLRFLENGMIVQTVEVTPPRLSMSGIDSPEDVALAEELIARHGDPFGIDGTERTG